MSNGLANYVDILIFAVIAVVLLLRLRSVLGTRSEDEAKSLPVRLGAGAAETRGITAAGPEAQSMANGGERWAQNLPNFGLVASATVHNHLTQFLAVDPAFRPDMFLDKARKAFEAIVNAFATGDKTALGFLLAPALYKRFTQQIDARVEKHETYNVTVHGIKKALITAAELNGTTAKITVEIDAEQSITQKDDMGRTLGDMDGRRRTTRDRWVFAKDLKDAAPTWTLENTLAHEE